MSSSSLLLSLTDGTGRTDGRTGRTDGRRQQKTQQKHEPNNSQTQRQLNTKNSNMQNKAQPNQIRERRRRKCVKTNNMKNNRIDVQSKRYFLELFVFLSIGFVVC